MPAPSSHTVLVHDAVDLAALAATLLPGQPQELLVLEEQQDAPRFAVRYGGARRAGHNRLTAAQQKMLHPTARIPVASTDDLLRPWPASIRKQVFAVDASGAWPAAEPEARAPAWIVFDDQQAFERLTRLALSLGASNMGSCCMDLPPGAWRSTHVWMLHLPMAPRFVLLTAKDEGFPVLVHDSARVLVPWGCRLVLPPGYNPPCSEGHTSMYLLPGSSRVELPNLRTLPISTLVVPEAGVPLVSVPATPASPPVPFRVRVGIYPSHSPRDPRLWLLRGPYAHASAERVLEAVPQDEYSSIQVAVLHGPDEQQVIVLREARQGQGRGYFDFGSCAVQLAPLAGLPHLHIPYDMEVQPVLDRAALSKIFGLEANRHTLVLPASHTRRGEAPESYELLTVRELDFAPLGTLIQHILHASRHALGAVVARAVFDFGSFVHALPAVREQAAAKEPVPVVSSHAAAPTVMSAPAPAPAAKAPDEVAAPAPAPPPPAQAPVAVALDVWEQQRKELVVDAHDNNDQASWLALVEHMAQRAARTQPQDLSPAWVMRDWLDAAIQCCVLDPCLQSPQSKDPSQVADELRAVLWRYVVPVARRIVAPMRKVAPEQVGIVEVIWGLDQHREWLSNLPDHAPSEPDPAPGRAISHRDTLHALTLLLGMLRWRSPQPSSAGVVADGTAAPDPFEVEAMPELYEPPQRPDELPRPVYPPALVNLMRCVSAKVSTLLGVLARSPRSPWFGTGHAVAVDHGLRRVSRHGSGPMDEIGLIRTGYIQGLVGAGTDEVVGSSAGLVRWLGQIVEGRSSSVDTRQGTFDPYMAQAAGVITAYGLAQLGLMSDASDLLDASRNLCEVGFTSLPNAPVGTDLYDCDGMLPGLFGAYTLMAIQGKVGAIIGNSDEGRWLGRLSSVSRRGNNCAAENLVTLRERMERVRKAEPDELWQHDYPLAERVFTVSHGYHYLESVWPQIQACAAEKDASGCAQAAVAALRGLPLLPKAQATRRGQSLGMGEAGYLLLRLRRLIPQLGIASALRPGLDYVRELIGTPNAPGALGEINMSNGLMRTHLAGCLAASGDHREASRVLVELCDGSWQRHRVSQILDLYEVLMPAARIIAQLRPEAREPAFMALVAASHIDRPLAAGGRNQVQIYRTNRARMILALIECVASKANRVAGLVQWLAQDEVHYLAPGALLRG